MQARQDGTNGLRIARYKSSWHCRFASISPRFTWPRAFQITTAVRSSWGLAAPSPRSLESRTGFYPVVGQALFSFVGRIRNGEG